MVQEYRMQPRPVFASCQWLLARLLPMALLLPVPVYAMTWGIWDFTQSGGWTDGGSSSNGSISTLVFVPKGGSAGSNPLNITFTNTVTPSFVNEAITSSTVGLNNLTVSGGNVTISYMVSPNAGDISPVAPNNQFGGTGPSGTIAGKSATFLHNAQPRTVTVTFSFAANTMWTAVSSTPIRITFDP
jgi:hypothetical protein